MPNYLVELNGESREVYAVEAESAESARDLWSSGELVVSEAYGMDVVVVREDDE
jgi:hypothetical protein